MKPRLVVFDDNDFCTNLAPFSCVRGAGTLRRGCFTQSQRIKKLFADFAEYFNSGSLAKIEVPCGDWLFVNSRVSPKAELLQKIKKLPAGTFLCEKKTEAVVAFRIQTQSSYKFAIQDMAAGNLQFCQSALYLHWWELVADNGEQIDEDFAEFFSQQDSFSVPSQFTTLLNPYSVWLGKDVQLDVGAVLDARKGAIVIEDGAKIGCSALLQGPCFVGAGATINPFVHIKNGSTIGKSCKVGGEVDGAIIDDFSNKQHYGFIGESYVGSWVNLGAGTTCSDLKNNYSTVKSFSASDEKIDTQRQFLGCAVGDYVRLGIGSLINTGACIGAGCCLYGSEMIDGKVGNFRFGKVGAAGLYELPKFLQTLKIMKARRNQEISENEEKKINEIFRKELDNYVD